MLAKPIFLYIFILIISFHFLSLLAQAQQLTIEWERTYGGFGDDQCADVVATKDGGLIIVGSTESDDGHVTNNEGNKDIWVIKLDNLGFLEWQKTYGGSGDDLAKSVLSVYDHGYLIIGSTTSTDGLLSDEEVNDTDIWVLKIDSSGNLEWDEAYGGSKIDEPGDAIMLNDSSFTIIGHTNSNELTINERIEFDLWLLNVDLKGSPKLSKRYNLDLGNEGAYTKDIATSISLNNSGNYLICSNSSITRIDSLNIIENQYDGDTTFFFDVGIINLNRAGDIIWKKNLGGFFEETGVKLLETSQNDIIVIGSTNSHDGDIQNNEICSRVDPNHYHCNNYWIFKLDSLGNLIREITYGSHRVDSAKDGIETSDKGFLVIGESEIQTLPHKAVDFWIGKFDKNLDSLLWKNNFGSTTDDYISSIIALKNSAFIVIGTTSKADGDVSFHFDNSANLPNDDWWIVKLSYKCDERPIRPTMHQLEWVCSEENFGLDVFYDFDSVDNYHFVNSNHRFKSNTARLELDFSVGSIKNSYSSVYVEKGGCFSPGLFFIPPFPEAVNDSISLHIEASEVEINILQNDIWEGTSPLLNLIDATPSGTINVTDDEQIISLKNIHYIPEGSNFSYQICDPSCLLFCDTAQVVITRFGDVAIDNFTFGLTPSVKDGINDFLKVNFLLFPSEKNEITIMNRWGQIIYRDENYRDNWDGAYKNKPLPPGPYYFMLRSKEDGQHIFGLVNLL